MTDHVIYNVVWQIIQNCITDYVLLQHGYIDFKAPCTICYRTRDITIYIADGYSNITEDIFYTILNIPKVKNQYKVRYTPGYKVKKLRFLTLFVTYGI